jgi:hypothetical protein
MRPWNFLFFLVYVVQKTINHFEGLTKYPVRKVLKSSPEEGGLGLSPEQAGSFLTDTALGWYIKALFGLLTDNLPLFGYRRKSWLILTSLLAGCAWLWVAVNGNTLQTLLVGLMIVNILVAFSDVVCDGLMVETAQRFEHRYQLPEGTANRPFQAAQWSGASLAMMVSAVAGGVIAQFFNLTTAALISGIIPVALAIVVAVLVKETRVAWDPQKARKGFLAIGVIVIVAFIILELKDIPRDHVLRPYEPLISAAIIIGCLLLFVRIPRLLIAPLVLVFCWQATPFDTGAQYVYQYFTSHNTAFVDAVEAGNAFSTQIRALVIALGLTDAAALATSGFIELFWGSFLGAVNAGFAILGAFVYRKHLQTTPFPRLFVGCLVAEAVIISCFLPFSLLAGTSTVWLTAVMAMEGFVFMIVTLAVLGYAAKRTPESNQASIFAFFMGMYNLGYVLGREQVGGRIYTSFADKTVEVVDGIEKTVLASPHQGMTTVILVSLVYLACLYLLVRYMVLRGHIVRHADDARHVF